MGTDNFSFFLRIEDEDLSLVDIADITSDKLVQKQQTTTFVTFLFFNLFWYSYLTLKDKTAKNLILHLIVYTIIYELAFLIPAVKENFTKMTLAETFAAIIIASVGALVTEMYMKEKDGKVSLF